MQYVYATIFMLSLILIPLYFIFVRKKQDEPWLFVLFISVSTVNLGYTLIAFSKSVEFALFANKIAYLGQVMMPLCMFMIISRLCGFNYKRWITTALIALATIMFAIICTAGYFNWYYTSATIETIAGATVLRKEYGILHPANLIYVIAYFIAMLTVLFISLKKRIGAAQKCALIMLAIVIGNIAIWCVQKIIPWEFELLSIIYLMSAAALFGISLMLQDYVHKSDIPKFTPAQQRKLGIDIATMPMEIKIGKVLTFVKEGEPLGMREREILEKILANKRRKEIAEELHLSENTVKTYVRSLYSKLGVNSREELYSLLLQE